ncbi:hypothetical protein ACIQH6_21290 [Micromonospora orduensis]|uniref:hypothetical protein n=1 Tax=Micromonospora orduensis TaxID=1420891 RepID=UPI0038268FE1
MGVAGFRLTRLTYCLPAAAFGAAALGAAVGADPAGADPLPLPTGPPPARAATAPKILGALTPEVMGTPLAVPLPLPSAVPLPTAVPLPSTIPLPTAVPLPTAAAPTSVRTLIAEPTRPPLARPTRSSPTAPVPSASPGRTVAPAPSAATVTRARAVRAPVATRPAVATRAATAVGRGPARNPPAGPVPDVPALVRALASVTAAGGSGGADPATSTSDGPQFSSPLWRGRAVVAVDRRAASRPVERGPPPPRHLLIIHPRPRR